MSSFGTDEWWTAAAIRGLPTWGSSGDRIAFVGKADAGVAAKRTIDAKGLIVAPGFIDMLGQSEFNLLVDKQAVSKLTQGITDGDYGRETRSLRRTMS